MSVPHQPDPVVGAIIIEIPRCQRCFRHVQRVVEYHRIIGNQLFNDCWLLFNPLPKKNKLLRGELLHRSILILIQCCFNGVIR
ncbi:hypothetical protein D3C75_1195600 [compost metagenome]